MNSIAVRLLLAATLVMALFIGLTTFAIQHTVDQRSELARFERMQGQIYALLGVTSINPGGRIEISSADLPNALMQQPMSGIYAEVRDTNVNQVWQSPSLTDELPSSSEGEIGQWKFSSESHPTMGNLFILRFAVEWLLPNGDLTAYQFVVGDSRKDFDKQRDEFNRNLWTAMLSMGALLLMSIALILAWGLSPLRRISRQLNQIENGDRENLPANVPVELHPLTSRINTLIASERNRQKRYRHTIDDLAHSLKTPLSVLRNIRGNNETQSAPDDTSYGDTGYGNTSKELQRQADRMEQIIQYHIKRADAGTQRLLTRPTDLYTPATRIIRSLEKVYRDHSIRFHNHIAETDRIRLEEADLMEILGNLLENACKYGAVNIRLGCTHTADKTTVSIDDDGPGFPEGMQNKLTKRGVRADTHKEGQGIGLAISKDLIENYGGTLLLQDSDLGGARVLFSLPKTSR